MQISEKQQVLPQQVLYSPASVTTGIHLLKHLSNLKRNFLMNRYAPINKFHPPNENFKAILCHKAARPNAQSFA